MGLIYRELVEVLLSMLLGSGPGAEGGGRVKGPVFLDVKLAKCRDIMDHLGTF
jgi:hypothetical protein